MYSAAEGGETSSVRGGIRMQVKSLVAAVGLGAAAGLALSLAMP